LAKLLGQAPSPESLDRVRRGMPGLKSRAKTLVELAQNAAFYARPRPLAPNDAARKLLDAGKARLALLPAVLGALTEWQAPALEAAVRDAATAAGAKLGDLAQPLRAALAGETA